LEHRRLSCTTTTKTNNRLKYIIILFELKIGLAVDGVWEVLRITGLVGRNSNNKNRALRWGGIVEINSKESEQGKRT
jgi:hypothetical protein